MREGIRFLLGHEERHLDTVDPTMTVLRYLREMERMTGTKEGCAEGDCGACTVVIGEPCEGGMTYRAVNSCIQFVPLLDGRQVITVEHLSDDDGSEHPVQQALCNHHASQCGFCTPGFVMSLCAQTLNRATPDRAKLKDVLAGNLCRCTGYGPILDAGEEVVQDETGDHFSRRAQETCATLSAWQDGTTAQIVGQGRTYYAPASVDDLAALCTGHPDAHIVSGLTDVGLWVTKQHRDLTKVIYIGNIPELKSIDIGQTEISIGAGATLAEIHEVLGRHYADLGELIRRFASLQIRNVATIGGNIANGSPIGDLPPALIALGSRLVLRRGDTRRTLPLEDYFIAYGQQDRQPGEFVERITLPLAGDATAFRCYKLSKRFDQDISAVCGAFRLDIDDGKVGDIRICFGGMAGTPQRASACEDALRGAPWTEAAVRTAMDALDQDYTPLTDMRASAAYRARSARNLLLKFFFETTDPQEPTRVLAAPEHAHG